MRRALASLTLACLSAAPLSAGVVYEIEVKDHQSSPPETTQTQVSAEGKNLKMSITSGEKGKDGKVIFHGGLREMVVVDDDQQSYMVIDEATLQRLAGTMSQVMAQMQEALKNVPEDKRAMVEQMMKERMGSSAAPPSGPKSELRKTGEKATKNGFPCVKYDVFQGSRKVREMWVTPWSNVEGGGEVRGAFEEMAKFFQSFVDAMPKMPGGGGFPGTGSDASFFTDFDGIDGFPVLTRELAEDGSLESESALRSAKRHTLSPEDFEPPAGYKRQAMPGSGG